MTDQNITSSTVTCNKIFFLAWVPPPSPPAAIPCQHLFFLNQQVFRPVFFHRRYNSKWQCTVWYKRDFWKGAIPQSIYLNLYNSQSLGRREVKGVSRRGHSRGGDSDESELLCSGYGGSKLTGHDRKHGSHGGHLEDIHSTPVNLHRSQLISLLYSRWLSSVKKPNQFFRSLKENTQFYLQLHHPLCLK